ncbi:MAG: hypothetical protein R3B09_05655 [Nannocystaceae bacterium]
MTWLRVVVIVVGVLSCAPEPQVDYESLQDDAERYCELLVGCYELPEPEDRWERGCVFDLLYQSEQGVAEGVECANSYATLVKCLSLATCSEYDDFIDADRLGAEDYLCKDEDVQFVTNCDETWGAQYVR